MPSERGAVDLSLDNLTPEQQEALDKIAEETGTKPEEEKAEPNVHLAFAIIKDLDGNTVVSNQVAEGIVPERNPQPDEIFGVLSAVLSSLQSQQTAAVMLQMQMQQMAAVQQQREAAALQQQIQSKGGYRGPGGYV